MFIKLYKYEFRTITGTWKQGSSYFVVKPIKYGLVLNPIIPIIIIGAEHFLIVVIVTYMHSKSGDSYVLSLTFNLLESFSKIFPNFFLSFSK